MNRDKLNSYGALFRFITPIMIAIIGWFTITLINDVKVDVRDMKVSFNNHLQHHQTMEIKMSERLICLETILEHMNKR
jgi:hypothetical protein